MKKKWERPVLMVLYKPKMQESVLTGCKWSTFTPVGDSGTFDDCSYECGANCCNTCTGYDQT